MVFNPVITFNRSNQVVKPGSRFSHFITFVFNILLKGNRDKDCVNIPFSFYDFCSLFLLYLTQYLPT
jgi:hypothetical protein